MQIMSQAKGFQRRVCIGTRSGPPRWLLFLPKPCRLFTRPSHIYVSTKYIYYIQIFKYFSYQTFSSKYFIFKMKSCPLFTRLFHPNVQIYVLRKDDTRGQLLNSEIHGVFNINTSRHLTSSFILWVFK